jgi:PST family polysaccharide transporter
MCSPLQCSRTSARSNTISQLKQGFLSTIRYTQVVIVPLCVGLFVTAEPIVAVVFGDQWGAAVPVLRVMAVFSLVGSIGINVGDVYKAVGRSDILAKLSMVEIVLLLPALLIGAQYGIVGVAWAHAAVAATDTVIRLIVARSVIGFRYREIGRELIPSFGAGIWLTIAAIATLSATSQFSAFTSLVATSAVGAAVYILALWRIDAWTVQRMMAWAGLRKLEAST